MDNLYFFTRVLGGLLALLVLWTLVCCLKIVLCNKKETSCAPRGLPHTESRARLILGSQELPTCVSHFTLPARPKRGRMELPPSYEEAVGVHRPGCQVQQPTTQPIATSLAQTMPTSAAAQVNYARNNHSVNSNYEGAIVVMVNERPTLRDPSSPNQTY